MAFCVWLLPLRIGPSRDTMYQHFVPFTANTPHWVNRPPFHIHSCFHLGLRWITRLWTSEHTLLCGRIFVSRSVTAGSCGDITFHPWRPCRTRSHSDCSRSRSTSRARGLFLHVPPAFVIDCICYSRPGACEMLSHWVCHSKR